MIFYFYSGSFYDNFAYYLFKLGFPIYFSITSFLTYLAWISYSCFFYYLIPNYSFIFS